MIGQNVEEILECDLKGEYIAKEHYMQGRALCREKEDYVSMALFEELLADEEGHIDFLETQLDLYKTLGKDKYCLLNAASADEAE